MPAGYPAGMLGMGDEMDGAMQQAAQPGRESIQPGPGTVLPRRSFIVVPHP